MNNFCDHFLTLKQQKVANFIKKSSFKCNNSKHIDTQYTLCLHCGQVRCNGTSTNQKQKPIQNNNSCSIQHYQSNKHPLILKLLACYVYCYSCQLQIQSMLDQSDNLGGNYKNKVEKATALYQKIRDLAIKNLPNIYSQRKNHNKDKDNNKLNKNQSKKQSLLPSINNQNTNTNSTSKNKSKQLRVFGLANIGNTCYFNSILQCLYATQQLHQFYQNPNRQFKDDLNQTFKKYLNNSQKVYNPKNILSLLSKSHKFLKGMDQQDAFQLYVILTDSLIQCSVHNNKNISFKDKIDNSIGSIFGFNCANRLECLSCGKISWNKDFNLGLTISLAKMTNKKVDIPQNQQIPQHQIGQQGLYYPNGQISNNFLDNYFNAQVLSKPNSYKCQKCSQSTATHKLYIKQPPQILTINFKRFTNTGAKINSYINIPPQILLNPHCLKPGNYRYQLYAGAVHSGSSRGGHYVAYTKRDKNWYYFSDSHCKPGSLNSLREAHPYIVFYRRLHEYDQQYDHHNIDKYNVKVKENTRKQQQQQQSKQQSDINQKQKQKQIQKQKQRLDINIDMKNMKKKGNNIKNNKKQDEQQQQQTNINNQ